MKQTKTLYEILILWVIFPLAACTLPYKIVPNVTATPQPTETSTRVPTASTPSSTSMEMLTLTPDLSKQIIDSAPMAGSVLTWSDYTYFVFVPQGEYVIGKNSSQQVDYAPMHSVTLDEFWIQQSEVTNQQYAQCVSEGNCSPPQQKSDTPYWFENSINGNHPVVGVTWFQANDYCASIQSRLPTEAEWEAAARGKDGKVFPWGGDQPNCKYSNIESCVEPEEPVDIQSYKFGASDFGVFDMSGNVSEWVNDWYAKEFYVESPSLNPIGPGDGSKKVIRGGSYKSNKTEIASYLRFSLEPEKQSADLGFRCVLLGNPAADAKLKMIQPCKVAAINSNNPSQATKTPFPCPDASVSGFCERLGGKASYGVDVTQAGCMDNQLNSLIANAQPLSCVETELSGGVKKYRCTFPGMAQGIHVRLSYCHVLDVQEINKDCPPGYRLNEDNTYCEKEILELSTTPCPKGYQNVTGFGCLPANDPSGIGCPISYFSVEGETSSYCFPVNKCLISTTSEDCNITPCAANQKFNPSMFCCDSVELPKSLCQANLIFDPEKSICNDPRLYSEGCTSVDTLIPFCPTLPPSATPTPIQNSPSCSDITDFDACLNSGCHWSAGFHKCF